jgi:hypothetical protein
VVVVGRDAVVVGIVIFVCRRDYERLSGLCICICINRLKKVSR